MSRLRNELYPLGFFGVILVDTLFKQWVVYSFAPPSERVGPGGAASALGSAKGIGALLLLGFFLQALAGPWIGQLSDRLRTPLGRRKPVVLAGLPLLALAFAATWTGHAPAWLVVPAYCLLFTIVAGPYLTLLPSLADTERTRVRLSLTGAVLALIGLGVALQAGPKLVEDSGVTSLAWVGLLGLALTALPATLLLREAEPEGEPAAGGLAGYARELSEVWRVPGLLRFLVGNGLLQGGFTSLLIAAPYVSEALLGQGAASTARLNGFLFVGMLLTIPLVGLSGRLLRAGGQIRVGAVIGALTLGALSALGAWASEGDPLPRWTSGFFLLGIPAMAALALPPVVLAAFSDLDGEDRQGVVFGLNGAAINLGNAFAAIGTTALLDLGKSAADPRGVRFVLAAVALVFALAALLLPPTPRAPKSSAEDTEPTEPSAA